MFEACRLFWFVDFGLLKQLLPELYVKHEKLPNAVSTIRKTLLVKFKVLRKDREWVTAVVEPCVRTYQLTCSVDCAVDYLKLLKNQG